MAVGTFDGKADGCEDIVGAALGAMLGDADGLIVGISVGEGEGAGDSVGVKVVGWAVTVGLAVGISVGEGEGAGDSVGKLVGGPSFFPAGSSVASKTRTEASWIDGMFSNKNPGSSHAFANETDTKSNQTKRILLA